MTVSTAFEALKIYFTLDNGLILGFSTPGGPPSPRNIVGKSPRPAGFELTPGPPTPLSSDSLWALVSRGGLTSLIRPPENCPWYPAVAMCLAIIVLAFTTAPRHGVISPLPGDTSLWDPMCKCISYEPPVGLSPRSGIGALHRDSATHAQRVFATGGVTNAVPYILSGQRWTSPHQEVLLLAGARCAFIDVNSLSTSRNNSTSLEMWHALRIYYAFLSGCLDGDFLRQRTAALLRTFCPAGWMRNTFSVFPPISAIMPPLLTIADNDDAE
ncbi:hypothetical protein B0H13DRAFT_1855860 [Mycena leptocephala]|nr:hypothetical protein B0H13DRAFT_1855860 [Mycena leptocephala]